MTYTSLANISTEHLGSDATDEDLAKYRDAVERVMSSREFDRDEEAASTYVWHNGRIQFDAGVCAYCDRAVLDQTIVPDVADDEMWGALSLEHDDDCEWITTRAHRANA